jgi:hypothetical protein
VATKGGADKNTTPLTLEIKPATDHKFPPNSLPSTVDVSLVNTSQNRGGPN